MKSIILLVVSLCFSTFIADINGQEQNSTVYSISIVDTCNYKFKRAQYTLFIPKGISRVRGILIHQHGCTMEGTGKPIATDLQYQAFAKKWDLAIIGPDMYPQENDCFEWNSPENGSDASLLKGIDSLSILSGHPELNDAPWLLWGHSGGGHWVLSMLSKHPQKVIALVAYSAAFDPKFNYPASVAKVPVLLRHAGKDDINEPPVKCRETAVNQFNTLRKMKGLASIVHNKNQTHNFSYIRRLTIPFFESVLQQRLPAEASNMLRDMDYSKSWLADTTGIKIYKASTFMGDKDSMSWLPDSITARKYQEFIQSGTILDHTLPPTPYHVMIKKQDRQGIKITWEADADIESGIKYFNIYKNRKIIQRFPAEGDYQYFDTNGDNPIPEIAPQMSITLPQTDIISQTDTIEITTVNHDGLESLKARGHITFSVSIYCKETTGPTNILYQNTLNVKGKYPELIINNDHARYTNEGLMITKKNDLVRLDKYYSLGERSIRYHVKFSENTKAVFQSNTGDFKVHIDLPNKSLSMETSPIISKKVDFINSNDEYLVEICHTYQTAKVTIINIHTGQSDYLEMTNDGPGGYGVGVINTGFRVGMQHDYYSFGLTEGDFLLVKQITILSLESDLTLLIYGDSITEPEDYFPTKEYPKSWTQLIMENINGPSISSGRGGCTINEILLRIKNELPYVKAKYVMITVGTNGGNTVENLSELVEYILSQNSIPILNNIPCNESRTHIEVNKQIEIVRQKYGINGCLFDLATSKDYKGIEVDQTTMFHEDYRDSWGQIYHHPNVEGSKRMYIRTLIDSPEIYQ